MLLSSPVFTQWPRRIAGAVLAGAGLAGFAVAAVAAECDPCSPYRLEAKYLHENWNVNRGGAAQGSAHLDKVDLAVGIDGEQMFNLPALTMFARVIYDTQDSISAELMGDAQGISNIEATQGLRIFELWSEWSLGTERSFRLGLYDFNSEFDANATAALFINPSHGIGKDISQSGRAGPSIFPVSSFGGRMRWTAAPGWSMQVAALDGVPGDPENPRRTTVKFDTSDGALLAAEVARNGDRLRKIGLGTWYYTGQFSHFANEDTMGAPMRRHGTGGLYALSEVQLWSPASDSERGLAAFLRMGTADSDVQRFGQYLGTGVVLTGFLMEDDQLGLAFARATNGDPYRREMALNDSSTDGAETNVELTWRFNAARWLSFQPDVQYIFNPNTDPGLADGLALGLRFEIAVERP